MESSRSRSAVKTGRGMRRILAGIAGLFALGGMAIWWHLANDEPNLTVPNPVMPSPNAFDNYVAAGRGIVSTKLIDDALSYKPTTPPTLEQKEAALKENAGVLQSLHEGFGYEYRNPPARSFSTMFPYFANFRKVARLLAMESQVRSAHGDWKGAGESALDAIRMGEDIPRGGVVRYPPIRLRRLWRPNSTVRDASKSRRRRRTPCCSSPWNCMPTAWNTAATLLRWRNSCRRI